MTKRKAPAKPDTFFDAEFRELYETNPDFKATADMLQNNGWSKENIVLHWHELQEDTEAGDEDIDFR